MAWGDGPPVAPRCGGGPGPSRWLAALPPLPAYAPLSLPALEGRYRLMADGPLVADPLRRELAPLDELPDPHAAKPELLGSLSDAVELGDHEARPLPSSPLCGDKCGSTAAA